LCRKPILGQYERLMRELSDEDAPAFQHFAKNGTRNVELLARLGAEITKRSKSSKRTATIS